MVSRCGCHGSQRVPLVDDDGEDAGDALGPYHVEGEHSQSAIVCRLSSILCAVDEELLDNGHPRRTFLPDSILIVISLCASL